MNPERPCFSFASNRRNESTVQLGLERQHAVLSIPHAKPDNAGYAGIRKDPHLRQAGGKHSNRKRRTHRPTHRPWIIHFAEKTKGKGQGLFPDPSDLLSVGTPQTLRKVASGISRSPSGYLVQVNRRK